MIDWWGLVANSLWIIGLAVGLAALNVANHQAHQEKVRLRQKLNEPGFQLTFSVGMTSFCLGLLSSSRTWGDRVIWALLTAAFAGQVAWLWWRGRVSKRAAAQKAVPESRPTSPRSRAARWLGWGLILAGLLFIILWAVITGLQLVDHARSLQDHLHYLERLAQDDASGAGLPELQGAGEHLAGLREDLEAIQSRVGLLLPAGRLLRWVPEFGGDLAAASDLLELAVGAVSAGARTFEALSPALELLDSPGGEAVPNPALGERLLPVLVAAQPELQHAQQELAAAEDARARIEIQSLSSRVASLLDRLDRTLPWFETAVDGALLAPGLLGGAPSPGSGTEGGPRTYLILAQNNHELRATGGFISGVGELRIEGGRLVSLHFSDSYAVDNLQVPHELTPADFQVTLLGELWFFRDTNWNADFPTSARRVLEVYARDQGILADGVITLDLTALALMVDAIGPIQVEGIADPVTGRNILPILQTQWANPSAGPSFEGAWDAEWWLHRKDFLGQIASASLDKLLAGQGIDPGKLARALKQALDEKHILIYLSEPQATGLLRERNWDGALPDPYLSPDLLLVVDSNVGFNKVDANVARSIGYYVDLGAAEGPRARLALTYQNRSRTVVESCIQESRYGDSYADMMDRCYWDYVRIYVPADSRLLAGPDGLLPPGSLAARRGTGLPQQALEPLLTEEGGMVWTAFFALEPLGERTLTFDYELPAWVLDREGDGSVRYRLRVQKQPGTEAVPFELTVILPPGAELVRTEPAATMQEPSLSLRITTDLRTDREFEVVYRVGRDEP